MVIEELRTVLSAGGLDLLATVSGELYDHGVPANLRAAALLPNAQTFILVGSGGPSL